jgi:copper homeostasis protein
LPAASLTAYSVGDLDRRYPNFSKERGRCGSGAASLGTGLRMSKSFFFELCAESLEAAKVAQAAGADRIELCEDLAIDGVTPSAALLTSVLAAVSIPVHPIVRPRGGRFVYTSDELRRMLEQIELVKAAGAAGIAVGVLLPDGRVDVERTRELIRRARPMKATFHRAFDETPDQVAALEDVIETGADWLLTSGGAANVLDGAEQIGRLQRQAGDRLQLMAGGGLRLDNLAAVVRRSGITCLHGSLSHVVRRNGHAVREVREGDVREAIRLLQIECLEPAR